MEVAVVKEDVFDPLWNVCFTLYRMFVLQVPACMHPQSLPFFFCWVILFVLFLMFISSFNCWFKPLVSQSLLPKDDKVWCRVYIHEWSCMSAMHRHICTTIRYQVSLLTCSSGKTVINWTEDLTAASTSLILPACTKLMFFYIICFSNLIKLHFKLLLFHLVP